MFKKLLFLSFIILFGFSNAVCLAEDLNDINGSCKSFLGDSTINPDLNGIGNPTDANVICKSWDKMIQRIFSDAGPGFAGEPAFLRGDPFKLNDDQCEHKGGREVLQSTIIVSGHVRTSLGDPIEGVWMTAQTFFGPTYTDITNQNGYYAFQLQSPWTGGISAEKQGWMMGMGWFLKDVVEDRTINFLGFYTYGGGSGSESSPLRIETAEHLDEMSEYADTWSRCFKVVNDINLSGYVFGVDDRIGTDTIPFTGVFDGNGQTISNLSYQNSGPEAYNGLFAVVGDGAPGSEIKNLRLVNPEVITTGNQYVGGLIGMFAGELGELVYRCYSASSVEGNSDKGVFTGKYTGGHYNGCFWDNMINGSMNGIGNTSSSEVMGRTTGQMHQMITFTDAGWDFTTPVWEICDGTNYPKLTWQIPLPGDFVCPDGVDMRDYTVLANQWQLETLSYDVAPTGGDGIVNFLDWAVFANGWQDTTDANDLRIFAQQWLSSSAYSADIAPTIGGDGWVNELDLALMANHWLTGLQ